MRQQSQHTYILLEHCYLVRKSLTLMLNEVRPSWKSLGFCEHTAQIKHGILQHPDFILASSHLSDGEAIGALYEHASEIPTILYSHLYEEEHARKLLPNIIKFIYEPVAREEMSEAASLLEEYMEVHNQESTN